MEGTRGSIVAMLVCFFVMTALSLSGCGNGTKELAPAKGGTSIHITDAPSTTFDHVFITVKEAWFHKLDTDDLSDPGWIKFPLDTPRTIDLAALSTGATQEVWTGLNLPAGSYGQIRVFLAPTEGPKVASLPAGIDFNNEVDYTDGAGAHKSPLRIPSPGQGIKVIPESPIVVSGGALKLALDFNADEDIVEVFRQGQISSAQQKQNVPPSQKEFLLKARLKYFDMNNAGAITGTIAPPASAFGNRSSAFRNFSTSFANLSTSFRTAFRNYTGKSFTIKAEQPDSKLSARTVRRSTTIDGKGNFVLYPLPIFGTATTATFDLVIRGRNVETFIVTGVKAHKGTLPETSTRVGRPITMVTNTAEFPVQVSVKPAGARVDFYQTIPNDAFSYEIRTRHVDPFSASGGFTTPIELSSGPLHVGSWTSGAPINFSTVTPSEGAGHFTAIARAELFTPSAPMDVSSLTPLLSFSPLEIAAPATGRTISGNIVVNQPDPGLDRGLLLITHGGIIVDTLDLSGKVRVGSNSYTTGNLPGGTSDASLSGAIYDLFAVGWQAAQPDTTTQTGSATGINLKTGNAGNANITLAKP